MNAPPDCQAPRRAPSLSPDPPHHQALSPDPPRPTHRHGSTHERVIVHLAAQLFEELGLLDIVGAVAALDHVDGGRDARSEVDQGVAQVAAVQRLV